MPWRAVGPGIIHIESIDVTHRTQARSNRMSILDVNMPGLERLVAEIRKVNAEAPIIFQLSHAGRLSDPVFKPPMFVYRPSGADVSIMTLADIEATREEFVAAAKRAWKVGADGVDFKQAHSFIGDDFLHPANTRPDQYGGSWENRTRFFRETLARMREEIPDPGFIIGSRITPYEGIPGAFGTSGPEDVVEDLSEPIAFAQLMEKSGIDFINVSAGSAAGNLELLMPTVAYPEGVYRHFGWTRIIKAAVSIPVIGSGYSRLKNGDDSLHVASKHEASFIYWAERNVREGHTDMVGVGQAVDCRPGLRAQGPGGTARGRELVHDLPGVHDAPRSEQAGRMHAVRQGVQGAHAEGGIGRAERNEPPAPFALELDSGCTGSLGARTIPRSDTRPHARRAAAASGCWRCLSLEALARSTLGAGAWRTRQACRGGELLQ